jgi:hypothetical protein
MAFAMRVGDDVAVIDVADEHVVFVLPGQLHATTPALDRLIQEYYSSPAICGADVEGLLRDFRTLAERYRERLRERLGRERKVRAQGRIRETILDEMTKDDASLRKLEEIVSLLERAVADGLDVQCSSD